MNVLLLGSGGREHALAWKIKQSSLCKKLYVAPGNAGTTLLAENVNINPLDFTSIGNFVVDYGINMVVVGPEDPLAAGIHDYFLNHKLLQNIPVIGPVKAGAQLESSKKFAKEFMQRHAIPTARYKSFGSGQFKEACEFLHTLQPPFVLKADGLAAGKGVLILDDYNLACIELQSMLTGEKLGEAGRCVVIEEFLHGIELSVFVITDGKHWKLLPEAKDYKRIGEGDTGLNTGGMGSVSPVPFADEVFMNKVISRIIQPTINGLAQEQIPYLGFIFFGLINVDGNPYVIEYNCRLGDPETQSVLPRLKTDLVELMKAAAEGELDKIQVSFNPQNSATIIAVAEGYPGVYRKGDQITGLNMPENSDRWIFHAGTKILDDGSVVTSGGRVLASTAMAGSLEQALQKAYKQLSNISFNGLYFRRDIGHDVIG